MKQFLKEITAVSILDDVERIMLNEEKFFRNVKAVYEQRQGFYVRGGCSGASMDIMEKLINIAKRHESRLHFQASEGSIVFSFYGPDKKTVGQEQYCHKCGVTKDVDFYSVVKADGSLVFKCPGMFLCQKCVGELKEKHPDLIYAKQIQGRTLSQR